MIHVSNDTEDAETILKMLKRCWNDSVVCNGNETVKPLLPEYKEKNKTIIKEKSNCERVPVFMT